MTRLMKDSGIEWIGEIPECWKTIRFKYLHDGMNTGEAIDKENWTADDTDKVFYTAGLVPIRTNYTAFPDWKFTTANDLLLARNGTPYVYYPQVGACYTDHIIRAMMKGLGNKRFIQYCLQQSIASVVVETVSIPTWSASLWNEQVIAWPPEHEQHRIADFLDRRCAEIDAVIERTKATIEEYKKLKQAVITEAGTKGVRGARKMKDSGIEWIGEIPEGWSIRKLKSFTCMISKGATPKDISREQEESYPIRFLKSENIVDNQLSMTPEFFISNDVHVGELKRSELSCDDILFVIAGASIGKVSLMDATLLPANTNQAVSFIRISKDYIAAKRFIWYVLQSRMMKTYITLFAVQSAQPNMSMEDLGDFRMPFAPTTEELAEIVALLDKQCAALDTLIARKTALLTELETYKKSLIYEYVTGKKEAP